MTGAYAVRVDVEHDFFQSRLHTVVTGLPHISLPRCVHLIHGLVACQGSGWADFHRRQSPFSQSRGQSEILVTVLSEGRDCEP